MPLANRTSPAFLILIGLSLAGCASNASQTANPFASARAPEPVKPTMPAINMAGRWILSSPEGGSCGMNFSGKPGAAEGAIAPEGGCPGRFFTSRHWAFDEGMLVIKDHKNEPLARLAMSNPPGRFEGQAGSGIVVDLAR